MKDVKDLGKAAHVVVPTSWISWMSFFDAGIAREGQMILTR